MRHRFGSPVSSTKKPEVEEKDEKDVDIKILGLSTSKSGGSHTYDLISTNPLKDPTPDRSGSESGHVVAFAVVLTILLTAGVAGGAYHQKITKERGASGHSGLPFEFGASFYAGKTWLQDEDGGIIEGILPGLDFR